MSFGILWKVPCFTSEEFSSHLLYKMERTMMKSEAEQGGDENETLRAVGKGKNINMKSSASESEGEEFV